MLERYLDTPHAVESLLHEEKSDDMAGKKPKQKLSLAEHHPFEQGLFNNHQHIPEAFANQKDELKKLTRFAKRSRIVGVQGELGSGKTTLLRHFCSEVLLPKSPVIFLRLTPTAYPRPFSQIAIAVLRMCSRRNTSGKIQIDRSTKLNFQDERRKLEASLQKEVGITLEVSPTVKIDHLFDAKVVKLAGSGKRTITYQQQNDSYAIALLQKLLHGANTRFYVVLDDFHYLRDGEGDGTYFDEFVAFTEKVYECLDYSKVTFFITLDDLVVERRLQAEAIGGGKAKKYTNEELNISGFTPKGVNELIHKRIYLFDYPPEDRPSFPFAGIVALSEACKGNPRIILDVLRTAMDRAEDEGTVRVSFKHVAEAIKETERAEISELEIAVLSYLSANGPSSITSDFWKGIGKSRATLQRVLPILVERGLIAVRLVGSSKNPKQEFYIPALKEG